MPNFWTYAGAIGAAPFTSGASLAAIPLSAQADSIHNSLQGWDPNANPYAGMPPLPTDQTNGVSLDHSGLDAFSKEAMRTGPSQWANLAQQQNQNSYMNALNRGAGQAASAGQAARDNMAMQGGLTSGASERVGLGQMANTMNMQQDVGRQAQDNALQISVNDEQNRMSELGQLPGMQLGAANFDLNKANAQNQFNAQNYQTQGAIWGAGQTAAAMDPRNPASPNYDDGKRWYNPFTW